MASGDIKGAINIVVSKETVLAPSNDTKTRLSSKHHPKHSQALDPPHPTEQGNVTFKVTRENLRKSIYSFHKGSAGGPDGLRPQHLIDMTGEVLGAESEKLLDSLVAFLNQIIFTSKVPPGLCFTFFGSNLMALAKPDGGIQPIAMGMSLRRLGAKCIMLDLNSFRAQEFQPSQLGVSTPKGAECAVHTLRSYLDMESNKNKVLLKIDFKNAFNSIQRDVFLPIIHRKLPNIYNYVYQNYGQKSNLFFGDEIIDSSEGVQQGDPLGPFLFNLGIMDIVKSMNTQLNLWYLDDGTIAGEMKAVLECFESILNAKTTHGLEINPSKCELFMNNLKASQHPLSHEHQHIYDLN